MKGKVFLFTIIYLFIHCGIAAASSGSVPSVVPKETPQKPVIKEAPKKPVIKEAPREAKTAAGAVSVPQKKIAPKKPVAKIAIDKERLKKKRLINKKKAALNNYEWDIEVMPLKGGKKREDSVIFKDNKIAVKSLLDKEFSYTNYTLTIKDNGTLVWETMQTSTGSEVVFIRGEVSSDRASMRGIISFPKGSAPQDYSFKSVSKQVIRN